MINISKRTSNKSKEINMNLKTSLDEVSYANQVEKAEKANSSVEFIGTATVLLKYGDLTIITDPAFDPAGGTYDLGFDTIQKIKDPAFSINELPDIDLVLLSHHQHQDNLDTLGEEVVANAELTITTPEGSEYLGGKAIGLKRWETHKIEDVTITALPAQHGPAETNELLGPVSGFLISSESGPTVYISGDTVPFTGTEEIVTKCSDKIDYALFHTGQVASAPDTPPFFSMSAEEAVEFANELNVPSFSIIHADSWAHFQEQLPEALEVVRASSLSNRLLELEPGQTKVIPFSRGTTNERDMRGNLENIAAFNV